MAISSNIDFPQSSYTKAVEQSKNSNDKVFFAVPGPSGPQGLPGPKGDKGDSGADGKQGLRGPQGNPGKSYFPIYEQESGWAKYINNKNDVFKVGANRGNDGWVDLFIFPSDTSITKFLPRGSVNLYNGETKKTNFKGLELGSQIKIIYNIELLTFESNTEVWFRTLFAGTENQHSAFVATLKYANTYELSITHNVFLEDEKDKISGSYAQIRTDFSGIAKMKSIYISVS